MTKPTAPKFLPLIAAHQKGGFMRVKYKKALKMRAAYRETPIFKTSTYVARPGVQYDNIGQVKEDRETGVRPEENAGLPYGEWVAYPYVISHKGEFQYRFTLTGGKTLEVVYHREDGTVVSKEEAEKMAQASEFTKPKEGEPKIVVNNLKEDGILELGEVKVGE